METDELLFFNQKPQALPIYHRLKQQLVQRIPGMTVRVSKTQIGFFNRRGFACVSFTPCRKAKDRPPVWLTVTFGLAEQTCSPRIDAATQPDPGRWTHHVMVGSAEELDDELLGWLQEAAAFSAAK